ncbi:uncharacterized protein LOC108626482 [Ceratina calcarata]|uniref:Uncharacterized protein LOC108626482 n=1 Tax=Ceratina calcarata TaxID=156304 RepID=A0AAJ7J270_9HYME|nr:uncharacterized protein LOC108626482 [Ceratina calcarata]
MKTIFLVGCIFLIAGVAQGVIKDDIMPELKEHIEPCAKEHDIPLPLDVEKFYDASVTGEEKTNYGCMKACMMKRMGLMENSKVNGDKIVSWMEKLYEKKPDKIPKSQEVVKKCSDEVNTLTDECEMAFRFSTCTVENDN